MISKNTHAAQLNEYNEEHACFYDGRMISGMILLCMYKSLIYAAWPYICSYVFMEHIFVIFALLYHRTDEFNKSVLVEKWPRDIDNVLWVFQISGLVLRVVFGPVD